KEIRDCGRTIRTPRVLRDSHRPEDAHALRLDYFPGYRFERLDRYVTDLGGVLQRERFQTFPILSHTVDPPRQELFLFQAVIERVFRDRGEPYEVRTRPRPEKDVRALGHFVTPDVGDNQSLTVELVCALDSRGDDRVCFRSVRSDDDDE